jgi:3-oxoadipate enol-lactonase
VPFVWVRELRMYHEIRGEGPRLCCISGSGGDLRNSPNAFDWPIASHFEILAYDQRGLGQTDRPDAFYTMEDYAAAADALLEAVGWDCCMVMGISFGGMVAQELALRYSHRVERLVLACTGSGGAGGASYPLHELMDLPLKKRAQRLVQLIDTRRDAAWQAANPEQYQELVAQVVASLSASAGDPGRARGFRRQLEARKQHDTYARLPNLRMPVYICGGRYDGIAPADNLQAVKQQIPDARLELFEGGHGFLDEDPRAFERITAFLMEKPRP